MQGGNEKGIERPKTRQKGIERLTAKQIRKWIENPKEMAAGRKLADGGGLYLVRLPSGGASWQIRYKRKDTDKSPRMFSVGPAAVKSIAEARAERARVKEAVKKGIDPIQAQRVARADKVASSGHLFSDIAHAWLEKEKPGWSAIHHKKSSRAIERDVMPSLGKLPVSEITPAMVSKVIEKIQNREVRDTAAKVLQHVRSIFRLAAAKGMRTDNPAEAAIEVLKRPGRVKHHPALLEFPELGDVLRRGERAPITPAVRLAHRLIAFTATRIANAVAAKWAEFDLKATPAIWTIPRERMKIRGRAHDHKVALPAQIATELRRWHKSQSKPGEFVFPGAQGGAYLSREAVEKALRVTMGLAGKHSPHGWRSSFSTRAKEDGGFDKEVVNLTLDHIHDTDVARAYDRGERLDQRVKLMKWWGDSLEQAERGGDVVPFKRSAA
jgi:integrase